MFSFLNRLLGRAEVSNESNSPPPAKYRFEMVLAAADVLDEFAHEINRMTPPAVPTYIASVRGWTIRFTTLQDYGSQLPDGDLEIFAVRLNQPIKALRAYLGRWDGAVAAHDPLLRSYDVLPGEEQMMDNVRVLLDRAIHAQCVALQLVTQRRG